MHLGIANLAFFGAKYLFVRLQEDALFNLNLLFEKVLDDRTEEVLVLLADYNCLMCNSPLQVLPSRHSIASSS